MRRILFIFISIVAFILFICFWYVSTKQPQRSGTLYLPQLTAPVSVAYDERGVPHIKAENQMDMYRALGYVQAQDRLFQLEIMRRLANGELSEILGPEMIEVDRLFRTLRLRDHANDYMAKMDPNSQSMRVLEAYLEGVNHYQESRPKPVEFDLLDIEERPFTKEDSFAIVGYTAYSFATAFRTEPLMTYIRDRLGSDYLEPFEIAWQSQSSLEQIITKADWYDLNRIAKLTQEVLVNARLPQFEGSNAWVISGDRTESGKPILAGDPHISFSLPSVWYEAHLSAPDFELYGHFGDLSPFASLGHNSDFGWSITMFQNDDLDLIAETVNPENANEVLHNGEWVKFEEQDEIVLVKGADPVKFTLRRSPNGPIINDALNETLGDTPVAIWWAFLETENPIMDAFYELNRADTLSLARVAASKIHAPGFNVMWANTQGDIAWWAAAKLPKRPLGVDSTYILDGKNVQTSTWEYHPFTANPQEENPSRGYIVSANHQPVSSAKIEIPGYYNLPDRGRRLNDLLSDNNIRWNVFHNQALQLDVETDYAQRVLQPILGDLRRAAKTGQEHSCVEMLALWEGDYPVDSVAATIYTEFSYQLMRAALADDLGEVFFKTALRTRVIDHALPKIVADLNSPWWARNGALQSATRAEIVEQAWRETWGHLTQLYGDNPERWLWGRAHTLVHEHPLGKNRILGWLLNVGPFAVPGSHEVPNNLSARHGSAPWIVEYGPSTRRIIDFSIPGRSVGILPVGQSGVLFDKHYADQALAYVRGEYMVQYLDAETVKAHTQSTLLLQP